MIFKIHQIPYSIISKAAAEAKMIFKFKLELLMTCSFPKYYVIVSYNYRNHLFNLFFLRYYSSWKLLYI